MNASEHRKFHEGELYDAYRYMGCAFDEETGKATFRVYAPHAAGVSVIGDFNGWNGAADVMNRTPDGMFEITVDGVKRYDGYKYMITTRAGETIYKSDPYAFHAETHKLTNSKVYPISAIKVNDEEYRKARAKKNLYRSPVNIYECHIGSWRKYPDDNVYSYRKFADEIVPYLLETGYNYIELMGIAEYPFDGSWGYQVTGYFAPTSRYGTPEDFCYLVEKLHAAGIGVILDWVAGHFPKDANGLYRFDGEPLYEPEHPLRAEHKEWGTCCFDYGRGEVPDFSLLERDDVVRSLPRGRTARRRRREHALPRLRTKAGRVAAEPLRRQGKRRGGRVPSKTQYGGVFRSPGRHDDRRGIHRVADGYQACIVRRTRIQFQVEHGWMNDTLSYAETDPFFRGGSHNKLTFSITYAFSENYILPISHDEVVHGKRSLINKMPGDYELKFAGVRNFLMNMYAHPGKKLLFMGCEFGQFIEWNEKREIDWLLLDYESHRKLKDFVSALNKFYLSSPPLWEIDDGFAGFRWNVVDDNRQNVIAYTRYDRKGNSVTAVINFSPVQYNNYRIGVDKGTYTEAIRSSLYGTECTGKKHRTTLVASHGFDRSIVLNIEPMSGVYLVKKSRGKRS